MPQKNNRINRVIDEPEVFEIRLGGHLQDKWSDRLEGMTITRNSDGTTTLYGSLVDQTALHSVLLRIRDMNLRLISVKCI
jgi:hypothetical protein